MPKTKIRYVNLLLKNSWVMSISIGFVDFIIFRRCFIMTQIWFFNYFINESFTLTLNWKDNFLAKFYFQKKKKKGGPGGWFIHVVEVFMGNWLKTQKRRGLCSLLHIYPILFGHFAHCTVHTFIGFFRDWRIAFRFLIFFSLPCSFFQPFQLLCYALHMK